MAAPKKVDYEAIEPGWRAGILSRDELAAAYTKETGVSVSGAAIAKHFNKQGTPRDLTAKIQAKAESIVAASMVAERKVSGKVAAATEREVIEANALRIAQVRGEHRADITRMRNLVLRLLAECEAEAAEPEVFAAIGEMLRCADERGQDRLNDAYQKAISLPQRIKGVKELAETLKTLIGLEREAYSLDAAPELADQGGLPSGMTPNDIARRIAFALTAGMKESS